MEGKVSTLRLMFPSCSTEQAVEALKKFNWDIDSTIDYLLVETEKEEKDKKARQQHEEEERLYKEFLLSEQQQKEVQQQIETEEDRIVKEFLILDGRQSPKPDEIVPHSDNNNNNRSDDEALIDEIEHAKKDVSILQSITDTLKELEAEVRSLAFGEDNNNEPTHKPDEVVPHVNFENVVPNNNNQPIHKPDEVVPHVQPNNNNQPIHKPDEVVPHVQPIKGEYIVPNNNNNNSQPTHKPDEVVPHSNNNNNNNNEVQPINPHSTIVNETIVFPPNNNNNNVNNNGTDFILQHEIDNAIKQIELAFNSSLEKTEQILLTLKDEVKSWKIRDNVKSITNTVRCELSDMLSALARLISPTSVVIDANTQAQFDEAALKEREAKRLELEKKLHELKEHNKRLEEERRIAIEKLESKKYNVSEVKKIQPQQATLIQPEIPKPQQATSIVIPQPESEKPASEEIVVESEQQPTPVSKNPFTFITSIFKKDN